MTTYNYHIEEQRIVYREYDNAISRIQKQYALFESLLNGEINSITISLKNIIQNAIYLYMICKDISSLPASADACFDDSWTILAKKYDTDTTLKEIPSQMKTDIGELLYPYLFKIYNAFSCNSLSCSRDKTNVDEYYYVLETDSHVPAFKMHEYFNDLRRLLTGLELMLKIQIITPNTYQGLPIKNFSAQRVIVTEKEAHINTMKLKLNKYKTGSVETKYIKNGRLNLTFENEFMLFDCYETSNKKEIESKMWSLIFYPKKDFQHLENYIALSKITRIKTTKVRDDSERWAIRFYDMNQNPTSTIVVEILEYIFKGIKK